MNIDNITSINNIIKNELTSTPKIMTFLPMLSAGNENPERELNLISQLLCLY